jgi:DNA-directed RNA polymerase specialized sigma24 family protein
MLARQQAASFYRRERSVGTGRLPEPPGVEPEASTVATDLLARLDSRSSTVIGMLLEGSSYAEIGEALGISKRSVKDVVRRARASGRHEVEGDL